jgi:hypothetical protein
MRSNACRQSGNDGLKDHIQPILATTLSPARRKAATAIRWLSVPLAAFVAVAPVYLLRSEYRRDADKIATPATVLDARVVSTSRVTTEWEVYVRYPVGGVSTENSVRVWSRNDLDPGDRITLLVDPATGDAEDDARTMSWVMAISGWIVAAFLWLAGFREMGAMLRRDRESRENSR